MSALAARTVGLHAAFWQYDRRYRWAWFVWPQAMALLIAGWLFADRAAPIAGDWAKPVDCAVPSNAGCAATQRSVLVFPDDVINPTLISQVTVVVDPSAFKTSSAADQPRLSRRHWRATTAGNRRNPWMS